MCAPSDNHEKRLIAMFDSFNKTVIRNFSRNLRKKKVNREKRCPEEPIDYILDLLSYEDRYPSDYFLLYADELSCVVYSETLYKALLSLSDCSDLEARAVCEGFKDGYRLGTKLTAAAFCDDRAS